jgi:hypothetical protein
VHRAGKEVLPKSRSRREGRIAPAADVPLDVVVDLPNVGNKLIRQAELFGAMRTTVERSRETRCVAPSNSRWPFVIVFNSRCGMAKWGIVRPTSSL